MRPAQQNRRMRGRGTNNRKGPNPLSRNYESNGPDVKIRGNAQHIAEKYTTLARDAQATGDRVIAENYLQHAEHYNRIILAAQAQNPVPLQRDDAFDDDGYDDDDMMDQGNSGQNHQIQHQEVYDGSGPQPVIDGTPAEVMYGEENSRSSGRNQRQQNNRPDRNNDRNNDRNDRNQGERNQGERNQGERQSSDRNQNDRNSDRNQNDRNQNDRGQNDRQNRMQRPRRHQRPDYTPEQPVENVAAPVSVPYDQSAEQPVIVRSAPVVTSTYAAAPAPVEVVAPVVVPVPAPVDVAVPATSDSLAPAPVVRRRPRVAAPVVQDADVAPVAVAAPVVETAQVAASDTGNEDAPAPRARRVLRPRRTTRTTKADGEGSDQDTALAETE